VDDHLPRHRAGRRQRKAVDRDRYERDLALQTRVRESYQRQAAQGWVVLDGERSKDAIAEDVFSAVLTTRAAVAARTSRTPFDQHARARLERRARRADIIHQHDDRIVERRRPLRRERVAHVAAALRGGQAVCVGVARTRRSAVQTGGPPRSAGARVERLVEAARAP
jgi:hypothetical protein